MAVNNPAGIDASIIGRIAKLEERLQELSATQVGKVKFATGTGAPVSPVVTSTPTGTSITVQVPPLATACGYSVFACGGALNTSSVNDYLQVKVEVSYGAYDNWTAQSASGIAPGFEGNVTTPMVDTFTFPAGGGLLTLTATMNNGGSGSWNNLPQNVIFPEGLFVFQY